MDFFQGSSKKGSLGVEVRQGGHGGGLQLPRAPGIE